MRRTGVAGLHLLVIDGFFDRGTVNVEGRARSADLGDLDEGLAHAITLRGSHLLAVDAAYGQILAECAVVKRISLRDELIDHLGADEQKGLPRSAVNMWASVQISLDSE